MKLLKQLFCQAAVNTKYSTFKMYNGSLCLKLDQTVAIVGSVERLCYYNIMC